jgi:general secretion pathway protein E
MSTKALSTDFVCAVLKEHNLIDDEIIRQIKLREKDNLQQLQSKGAPNGSSQVDGVDVISAMELRLSTNANRVLSEELIMKTLADHWQLPFLRIDIEKLNPSLATSKVSEPFATKHLAIPISISKRMLFVAVTNPLNVEVLDTLRTASNLKIRPVISTKTDILKAIEKCYKLPKVAKAPEQDLEALRSSISAAERELASTGGESKAVSVSDTQPEDKQIVNVVNLLLHYAFEQRTSEIHIEPKQQHSIIRFRIDGILYDVKRIPIEVYANIIQRVKALAKMNISEKRKPQDGRTQFNFHDREIHLRISTIPVVFGEKMMMRILDPIRLFRPVDDLGFSPEDLDQYLSFISRPSGIILIAGPTGCGKTTTLYSTLNRLSETGINIITIEDPIESVYEGFNQIIVQPALGVTFESAIRHIVRQSPDVIMVGEIRDTESVEQTIQAALTGHLVISTLHTDDAPSAIIRLVNIGAQPFLVESTVIAVIAQRLIRKICTNCAKPYQLSPQEIVALQCSEETKEELPLQKGTGCEKCRGTGYFGQTAIFELMEITDEIRALIHNNAGAYAIRNAAIKQGMRSLKTQAITKMKAGITTCDEVLRVSGGLKEEIPHQFKSRIFLSSR